MQHPVRILLVDDHGLFRESLRRLLDAEPDFRVIGSFASGLEALDSEALRCADVALLDYDLGEEHGAAFLEKAAGSGFSGRILIVTAAMAQADMLLAFQRGIAGIFFKHNPPPRLIAAIRQVISGATWVDERTMKSIIAAAARANGENSSPSLNHRDRAVLKALLEGLTNKEIAVRLNVPEASVKWSLQQLFDKTGVRNRTQLVRIALEMGATDW